MAQLQTAPSENQIQEMKFIKLVTYYAIIAAPLALVMLLGKQGLIGGAQFCLYLFAYAFLYRPVTDYHRLLDKGVVNQSDFWKCFVPFLQMKYFKELYLP